MPPEKTDSAPRIWDLPVAFVLLTRLPVPALPEQAFAHPARAVWAYPVVGLSLAVVLCLAGAFFAALGISPAVTAGLMLAGLILLTGAMHEDGLADTADGLWGGQDPARRLEIMKDSRIGAYGVLALIIALGLRWLTWTEASWPAIVIAFVVSRAMMPTLMLALPHARAIGLSHSVGTPPLSAVIAALMIGAAIAILLAGGTGLIALVVSVALTALIGRVAQNKINGQTGDILGATQICTEIAILIVLIS
jgi:adenosylcobinamide-GDP ribazoletransferase